MRCRPARSRFSKGVDSQEIWFFSACSARGISALSPVKFFAVSLDLSRHKLPLQPFVHFLGPPQRLLHVLANIFLADDFRELRLVN